MRNKRGITLIALIITIIVMLIMVGVTINVALNGGLIEKARTASVETQKAADREELLLAVVASIDKEGKVDIENLKKELGTENWETSGDSLPCTCTKKKTRNSFTVAVDGTITEVTGAVKPGEDPTEPEETVPENYQEAITGLDEKVTVIAYKDIEGLNNAESENTYLKNLGTNLKTAVDSGKISSILTEKNDGVDTIAVIPTGFTVSTEDTEDSISEGLVLKDGANEYVWIPYTDSEVYIEDSFGPLTATDSTSTAAYDSQEQLDYYYGENYYNYSQDFTYEQDKTNIEESINKYRGFIVGRYETTITNAGVIGSMPNETVLQASKSIAQTNNKECRWYGLYKVQKDLYPYSEDGAVFSSMITSKEWDRIMAFTGYGDAKRATNTYTTKPDKSGSSYKDSNPAVYDETQNIYDLAGNLYEMTLKADNSTNGRDFRGGCYLYGLSAFYRSKIIPSSAWNLSR